MSRRGAAGPMEFGPITGRGLGFCNAANTFRPGLGLNLGFGLGRGWGYGSWMNYPVDAKTRKEILEQQKAFLQDRLDMINKQLDGLSNND